MRGGRQRLRAPTLPWHLRRAAHGFALAQVMKALPLLLREIMFSTVARKP